MTAQDWKHVIDQAAELGISMVQLIGGEPTTHPDFADLLSHAIAAGLAVEVFSNLVHVKDSWWDLFACGRVSLATSYYSDVAAEHENITARPGSHAKTRRNIEQAVARGIPLRAGIIDLSDGQRVEEAKAELAAIGVTDIGVDRLRQVGRGGRIDIVTVPNVSELCGNCGRGVAAVSTSGEVWPCVFSRWMGVGNVRMAPLADILNGAAMAERQVDLDAHFGVDWPCVPKMCDPQCGPSCSPSCTPTGCSPNGCQPNNQCQPKYSCGPCAPKDTTCNPDQNCRPNQCRPTR
jgi:MoaA/NifB/PqqE/SkfB family radical SAM enzyme